MMMKVAGPGGTMVHALALTDERKPVPRWVWGAVAVSLALHAGAGAWLYYQKVVAPTPMVVTPERPTIIDIFDMPKPKPKPVTPPTIQVHKPPIVDTPVDTPPAPFPPTKGDVVKSDGPPVLPTAANDTAGPPALVTTSEPAKGPPVISSPRWISKPTGEQVARYYPPRALESGTEGSVMMSCTVTASGSVTACRVTSETPAGQGFGNAGIRLSKFFKMSPKTVDGAAVEGAQVNIPLKFTLQ
jgi:protein TonB